MSKLPEVGIQSDPMSSKVYSKVACYGLSVWTVVQNHNMPSYSDYQCLFRVSQVVTKRCRLSWRTNSALVYEPKYEGRGELPGSQPMRTAVHRSPNKLWIFNSILHKPVVFLIGIFYLLQVF
jgi:hypothetical protein